MAPLSIIPVLLLLFFTPITSSSNTSTSSSVNSNASPVALESLCQSTPYPVSCLDSLKLTVFIGINPSIISVAIYSLLAAISDAIKLSSLLSNAATSHGSLVESQRGALQDCRELHQITIDSLRNSASLVSSNDGRKIADVRAHLSAALTNRATCLDGLAGARGSLKDLIVSSWQAAYTHVSNSLSLVARSDRPKGRRLFSSDSGSHSSFPEWLSRKNRRLLEDGEYDEYDPGSVLTVAADGTGNFTTISDAVAFAPNNSAHRTIIVIQAGVYNEHVEIPSYKTNIVLIGEGRDVTVITGDWSAGDGWTNFRSATVAVSGERFLARDITFKNTAGPGKGQAVALRVNADLIAVYHCAIDGFQDTLYVHSFRQFYRECDIYGTVDFIFGNAAVVFQGCNIVAKKPLPGQSNVVTAQSRDEPDEDTGISIQNCTILASDELASSDVAVKTYLGRPWRIYSRTVYIESYMDELIDPAGWMEWSGDQGLDTLYYGEYMNNGPGSDTDSRVSWPGYRIMDYDDAYDFTVSELINGDDWLDSTLFPYDEGI